MSRAVSSRKSKESIEFLYIFYDYTCQYCSKKLVKPVTLNKPENHCTIDHIIPRSCGGSYEYTNLTLACKYCNSRRGNGFLSVRTQMQLLAKAQRFRRVLNIYHHVRYGTFRQKKGFVFMQKKSEIFIKNAVWGMRIDLSGMYRRGERYEKFILTQDVPTQEEITVMQEEAIQEFGNHVLTYVMNEEQLEAAKQRLLQPKQHIYIKEEN